MIKTFKEFLKEEVTTLKVPAKEEYKRIMDWKVTNKDSRNELADAIHNFVVNTKNPMNDRKEVLQRLDDLMGVENPPITNADVAEYTNAG